MSISKISQEQWFKVLKAAAYVGVSAAIAKIIAMIASDPSLFGQLTPIINIVLVLLKQAFTSPE